MKIPIAILENFEGEAEGISFGKVTLEALIHDGSIRYRIVKEVSFIPNRPTSGSAEEAEKAEP